MQNVLVGKEAEDLIKDIVPFARHKLVELPLAGAKIKFPVVLKVISKQIPHKTEANAVAIIHDKGSLKSTSIKFLKLAHKTNGHVVMQNYAEGIEVAVGIKKDPIFGHVMMFGLGGIFIELLKDVSFRICPINQRNALQMINELKAKELFYGYRGNKVNTTMVAKMLVSASELPERHPEIIELDINPVIIKKNTAVAVDARVVVER